MARTKNPSAATRKAWETRRRNAERSAGVRTRAQESGGSDPTASKGDYLSGPPRWTNERSDEQWVNEVFGKALKKLPAPVRRLIDRFLPSVYYQTLDHLGMPHRGGYKRFVGAVAIGDASSTADIIHEIGHAVDHALKVKGGRHPGPGLHPSLAGRDGRPWAAKLWSETNREFGKAFREDVAALKKKQDRKGWRAMLYTPELDWDYTASKKTEGFAAAFADIMGFPKEDALGDIKPGYAKAFPRTRRVVLKKLKAEGLAP